MPDEPILAEVNEVLRQTPLTLQGYVSSIFTVLVL